MSIANSEATTDFDWLWQNRVHEEEALCDLSGHPWTIAHLRKVLTDAPLEAFRNRRIATLVEDPVLSALVTTSILHAGACLPLNPNWTQQELVAICKRFSISALVMESPAKLKDIFSEILPVIEVSKQASKLHWKLPNSLPEKTSEQGQKLILLTSGSTGEPKAVPLRVEQLEKACADLSSSLQLTKSDTCLNFLPMMHIGGYLDLFLAPLSAGGRIVFGRANDTEGTVKKITQEGVTWIQGAPAMLQHLLSVSELPKGQLRFIRSVSAPLPVPLLESLEERFQCPVIEIYGMSETCGVITSNPLPPWTRKAGSVGLPIGCEVEVSASGNLAGEVRVRGPRVFSKYLDQPGHEADRENGWFETGDLGYLDEEGYLFLTGRSKEEINRGGQKVSPLEIDNLSLGWPEVREAAAFSIPHPTLGEEVAVALVLNAGESPDEEAIKARFREALAEYKVPKRIYLRDSLPRNENGKLQRHLLASTCQNEATTPATSILSETESRILALWKTNLTATGLGPHDDYFESGGDSLSMTSLILALEREFAVSLKQTSFFEASTVSKQAKLIESHLGQEPKEALEPQDTPAAGLPDELCDKISRALQSWEGTIPYPGALSLFADQDYHEGEALLAWCGNTLAEWKLFLQATPSHLNRLCFRSLSELQRRSERELPKTGRAYAEEIQRLHPEGEIALGGYCAGAALMEEVAAHLLEQGRSVKFLFCHDYVVEKKLPNKIALFYSDSWSRSPLYLFPNLRHGFDRYYGNQWLLKSWSGDHNEFENPELRGELAEAYREFLTPLLAEQMSSEPSTREKPLRPRYELELASKRPLLLKKNEKKELILRLRNSGETPIEPGRGLVLQARWTSYNRKTRYTPPMRSELVETLAPGESCLLQLAIHSPKSNRLDRLEIAFIEEGLDWVFPEFVPCQTLSYYFFIK